MKEEWDGVDEWRGEWDESGSRYGLSFTSFSDHRDGTEAECRVWIQPEGIAERVILSHSLVKLLGPNVKRDLVRSLAEKSGKYPWATVIEIACQRALGSWREGKPAVDLADVMVTSQKWIIEGFMPDRVTSSIFSDGASGKSYIMTACAVAIASGIPIGPFVPLIQGNVLIINAETDEHEYAERVARICDGAGIAIPRGLVHQEQLRPLVQSVRAITAQVKEVQPVFGIIDSAGALAHGSLNNDDVAIPMTNALRQSFGPIGRCLITHTSKASAAQENGHGTAVGSAFFRNYVRSQWEARRETDGNPTTFSVALIHIKSNRGAKQPDFTTNFDFDDPNGPVTLYRGRITDNSDLARYASKPAHITAVLLKSGALTLTDLASETGMSESTLRRSMREMTNIIAFPISDGRGGRGLQTTYGVRS